MGAGTTPRGGAGVVAVAGVARSRTSRLTPSPDAIQPEAIQPDSIQPDTIQPDTKEPGHEGRYRHRQRGAHAGRGIQRGVREPAGARARQGRHQGRARAGRHRGGAGLRGHHGADPVGRAGPKSGPPGLDCGRHPGREPGLGRQPALRLRAAHGRARLSGHPQRRFGDRGRGRPGIHEHGAALCASAQWREDGQFRDGRHHDQGWPVGRLQRLSHGQYGGECRPEIPDHPPAAG